MNIIAEVAKSILIDTNLSNAQKSHALNSVHDLLKALKEKAPSTEKISAAHEIYQELWYKIGSFVTMYDSPSLWIIIKYNTSTWDMYDWQRYPIIVKFPFGTFEYSILSTHYEEVEKYKNDPNKIFEYWKEDIATHVVKDIDQATAEKIIATQELLEKMSEEDLINYYNSESFENEKLPYIKEYVINRLKILHRRAVVKMVQQKTKEIDAMNLDELIIYFQWEIFAKDKEENEIKKYVYDKLNIRFNNMSGENLLKLYEKDWYWGEIKNIMRKIIENK